jgi:hypothetical protein
MEWKRRMKPLEQEDLPKVHGFYHDGLHRSLVVADVHDRRAVVRLLDRLRDWHKTDEAMRNPPSLLSVAAFQTLLWSSYLDTPFLHQALSPVLNLHSMAARRRGRSALFGWGRRVQWKMTSAEFLPPPKALLDLGVELSLSSLALSLRLFGLNGWSGNNGYRIGLLYSRLMSAHLYKKQRFVCDPDDLEGLAEAYKSRLPESYADIAGPLEEALRQAPEDFNAQPQDACFHRHYPSYRLLLERAMS